jgi:hypothetical protein
VRPLGSRFHKMEEAHSFVPLLIVILLAFLVP